MADLQISQGASLSKPTPNKGNEISPVTESATSALQENITLSVVVDATAGASATNCLSQSPENDSMTSPSTSLSEPTADAPEDQDEGPKFKYFSKLPYELRLVIWESYLPEPKVVCVELRELKKTIGEWENEQGRTWPLSLSEMEHLPFTKGLTLTIVDGKLQIAKEGNASMVGAQVDSNATPGAKVVEGEPHPNAAVFVRVAAAHDIRADLSGVVDTNGPDAYRGAHMLGYHSKRSAPKIRLVCQDSWGAVLRNYYCGFSTVGSVPETYIDFRVDTLYLNVTSLSRYLAFDVCPTSCIFELLVGGFGMLDFRCLSQTKKLALLLHPEHEGPNEDWLVKLLRLFSNLDSLTLVLNDYRDSDENTDPEIKFVDAYDADAVSDLLEESIDNNCGVFFVPFFPDLETAPADVELPIMEELHAKDSAEGLVWQMPEFHCKIAISEKYEKKLQHLEYICNKDARRLLRYDGETDSSESGSE